MLPSNSSRSFIKKNFHLSNLYFAGARNRPPAKQGRHGHALLSGDDAQVYNLRQKTTTTTTGDDTQGHHGIQPRAQHRSKQPLGENLEYEAENCLTKYYQRIV